MDRDTPWDTDAAVLAAVEHLIESALRRQTWLFALDEEHRGVAAVAIDGVPVDPDPEDVEQFAGSVRLLLEQAEAESVVVVWERAGGPDLAMQEADWAAAVAASGAPVRAQLVAHDHGVRLLDPAFEAIVA